MMIEPFLTVSFGSHTGSFLQGASPRPSGDSTAQRGSYSAEAGAEQLSETDRQAVQELKQRDQEVRAHERAHMSAGAGVVQGGASFSMQRGPDGRSYAVGGEVKIDTSAENDPEQTIRKMQQIKRAALAPAEPSSTDRAVAAQAGKIEAQARQEKNRLERIGQETDDPAAASNVPVSGTLPVLPGRLPYSTAGVGLNIDVNA